MVYIYRRLWPFEWCMHPTCPICMMLCTSRTSLENERLGRRKGPRPKQKGSEKGEEEEGDNAEAPGELGKGIETERGDVGPQKAVKASRAVWSPSAGPQKGGDMAEEGEEMEGLGRKGLEERKQGGEGEEPHPSPRVRKPGRAESRQGRKGEIGPGSERGKKGSAGQALGQS